MTIEQEIAAYEQRISRYIGMYKHVQYQHSEQGTRRMARILQELGWATLHLHSLQGCLSAYQRRWDEAMDDPTGQDLDTLIDNHY